MKTRTRIKLLLPHVVNGHRIPAGRVVSVGEGTAGFLLARGAAIGIPLPPPAPVEPEPERPRRRRRKPDHADGSSTPIAP